MNSSLEGAREQLTSTQGRNGRIFNALTIEHLTAHEPFRTLKLSVLSFLRNQDLLLISGLLSSGA